jgi:hypothetical protein
MAFSIRTLTANDDYIAFRNPDHVGAKITFDINGIMGGAKLKLWRLRMNKEGNIAFDYKTPFCSNDTQVEYVINQACTIDTAKEDFWYMITLHGATQTTAIAIQYSFPNEERNVISNITTVQKI